MSTDRTVEEIQDDMSVVWKTIRNINLLIGNKESEIRQLQSDKDAIVERGCDLVKEPENAMKLQGAGE